MKSIRIVIVLTLLSALFVFVAPGWAQDPDGEPDGPIDPPQSRQVSNHSISGEATDTAEGHGNISPIESSVPMPLPKTIENDLLPAPESLNDVSPSSSSSAVLPSFDTLPLPMYHQDPEDVSCGVQALSMALSGLEGSAPNPNALLNFLSGQGMLYDFGTGVEELAYAAQSFGYAGSLPFHGASFVDLESMLDQDLPPVVALGSNGAGEPGHFVTVTGISPDGEWVAYNDPALGRQVLRASEFEQLWTLQGHSGVFVASEVKSADGSTLPFAPWVAMAAGLMAIISQTPLALYRLGIGGKLASGVSSGGSTGSPPYPAPAGYKWTKKLIPQYKTVWKQDGWTYENKTVPKYDKVKVQVGTTTVYDKIPRMKTIKVQDGWDVVEKVVPRMVSKRVQVGTTTVYDKIPQYKTVRVQDGWTTTVDRVPQYKTVRYVKYYRTTRERKPVYSYRYGRRYLTGYRYVTKRTPVYGTRKVFNGYKRVTKRVPNYVNKRVFNGFKVVATEVPNYEWRTVQDGWQVTHESVPHMVEKRVQDGWDFVPQEVPKYEWRDQQVGWTTEKHRVPKMVSQQVQVGTKWEWTLEGKPQAKPEEKEGEGGLLGNLLAFASNAVNTVTSTVSNAVDSVGSSVDSAVESVGQAVSDTVSSVVTTVSSAVQQTVSTVHSEMQELKQAAAAAISTATDTIKQAASTVVDTIKTAASSVADAVTHTAKKASEAVQTAVSNVKHTVASAASAVGAVLQDPLGAVEDAVITAGQNNATVRNVLTGVLAPAADFLSSADDAERNPQTAAFRTQLIEAYDNATSGWRQAFAALGALADYTASAAGDARWGDLGLALQGWGQILGATVRQTAIADVKGIATVLLGIITTPYRLVTQSIPNFYDAVTGRLDGEDRAWDVLLSGALLEGDLAGTYALGKTASSVVDLLTTGGAATGSGAQAPEELVDVAASDGIGLGAEQSTATNEVSLLEQHYGSEIPLEDRASFAGWHADQTEFGPGTELYRVHTAVEDGGSPYRSWWSTEEPTGELQFRIDLAVKPEWNTADQLSILRVPEGEVLSGWSGDAGYVDDFYIGGGNQVYLEPGSIDPDWVSTEPAPWRISPGGGE
jgi:hypothetical protein